MKDVHLFRPLVPCPKIYYPNVNFAVAYLVVDSVYKNRAPLMIKVDKNPIKKAVPTANQNAQIAWDSLPCSVQYFESAYAPSNSVYP